MGSRGGKGPVLTAKRQDKDPQFNWGSRKRLECKNGPIVGPAHHQRDFFSTNPFPTTILVRAACQHGFDQPLEGDGGFCPGGGGLGAEPALGISLEHTRLLHGGHSL